MVGGLGSALGDEHGDASCGVGDAAGQVELVDPIVLIVLVGPVELVALAKLVEPVGSVGSTWLARLIEGVESAGRARVVEWGERIGLIRPTRGVGREGVRCRGSGLGDTRLLTASRGRLLASRDATVTASTGGAVPRVSARCGGPNRCQPVRDQ